MELTEWRSEKAWCRPPTSLSNGKNLSDAAPGPKVWKRYVGIAMDSDCMFSLPDLCNHFRMPASLASQHEKSGSCIEPG
jgi:hypothetical protein